MRDGVILGPFDESAAPHPTKFDPSFRNAQFCSRCHNVVSGPAQFYNVGPCGTYAEYEGKYFMQERGFICQSCHMPEVDRPVAENGPIRRGRRHLWRGGHDPDMVKRAVAIQVKADPPAPKPDEQVTVTLSLMNAGAGHKIPTGDPDRQFTEEFTVDYYFGIQSFAEHSAGRLYLGTWGRHVARFDPDSGEFLDYGPVGSDQGYGYVYTIAADSRYVYCGMAVSGKWYLVVLNQETKAWEEFFKPADPRHSSGGSVIRYQDGSVGFGGKYLIQDGKPVEVDPQVLRAKKPWTSSGDSVALAQAKEIGLEIDIDGMQPTNFNDCEVIVRWRKIGAPEWREARTTGADVRPNCVKRLAALPDGTLIGESAFYGNIFIFDPATRQSRLAGVAPFSVYDILVNGPMVYFSGYPTAFAVYDTRRPWTFSKKKELGDSSQNPYVLQRGGKYNYQSALGADGRVYICGNHQRHDSGASLNWFDPAKPNEITHLRQGFEGHQPSDVVALDKGRFIPHVDHFVSQDCTWENFISYHNKLAD